MASELQVPYQSLKTVYFLVRDRTGQIWSTSGGTGAFEAFDSTHYPEYKISASEQGSSGSAYYVGSMPAAVPAGVYGVQALQQLGGSAVEYDLKFAGENFQWNGSAALPLSDLATSGQIGQIAPIRPARGVMIRNYPVYFKSSADHVTPLVSGVVSGQISRDGAAFTALQSGAFTEIGNGCYNLQALTSGDLLCNSAVLLFTANGVSGGAADPVVQGLLTQRTSGQ